MVDLVDSYLIQDGKTIIRLIPDQGVMRLGRDRDAEIPLKGGGMSRQHAKLEWRPGAGWLLADAGSRNGVYCQGDRLRQPRVLDDGAVIHLGGHELRFHLLPHGANPEQLLPDQEQQAARTISIDAEGTSQREHLSGPVKEGNVRGLLRFFAQAGKGGLLELRTRGGEPAQVGLVDGLPRFAHYQGDIGFRALRAAVHAGAEEFQYVSGHHQVGGDPIEAGAAELFYGLDADLPLASVKDLDRAGHVQRHLLVSPPSVEGYDLAVHFEPLTGVGGDFYEFHQRKDGRVLLFLGDVAGHGVQAAISMATVLKSLRRHAELLAGSDILKALNREVGHDLVVGQFVTAWIGLLDCDKGELETVLAGHHPPLLVSSDGGVRPLGDPGMALGMAPDAVFSLSLHPVVHHLEPGESLLQFSDALIEAVDHKGRAFGHRGIGTVLKKYSHTGATLQVRHLAEHLHAFAEVMEDDLTIMSVERLGGERSGDGSSGNRQSIDTRVSSGANVCGDSVATTDSGGVEDVASEEVLFPDLTKLLVRRVVAEGLSDADYRLGPEIGRGGMGVVHRAVQRGAGRTVALKRLQSDRDQVGDRHRFLTEALAVASLDHPHILSVYDVGLDDALGPFYVMPLLTGHSLAEVHSRMDEVELLDHILAVADALVYAHDHGIVHRDIKPANILLGDYGEVYLVDWGLAAAVGELPSHLRGILHRPESGRVVGTPAYMPPEMARGEGRRVGPWSDVYLLAGLLLELTTGRVPHEGASGQACLAAARANLLPDLDDSDPLQGILVKALSTDIADRPQHVSEFRDQLLAFRRQRQALTIVRQSLADLSSAGDSQSFRDFDRAVHGFEQALLLSQDLQSAQEGYLQSRADYASLAMDRGELALAESLLDASESGHESLFKRLEKLKGEQDQVKEELQRLRGLEAETERHWSVLVAAGHEAEEEGPWRFVYTGVANNIYEVIEDTSEGQIRFQATAPQGLITRQSIAGERAISVEGVWSSPWVTQLTLWLGGAEPVVARETDCLLAEISVGRHGRVHIRSSDKIIAQGEISVEILDQRHCWRLEEVAGMVRLLLDGEVCLEARVERLNKLHGPGFQGFTLRNATFTLYRAEVAYLRNSVRSHMLDLAEGFAAENRLQTAIEVYEHALHVLDGEADLQRARIGLQASVGRRDMRAQISEATRQALVALPDAKVRAFRDGIRVDCHKQGIRDLDPLRRLPITSLRLNHNAIRDLSPLADMPLVEVNLIENPIDELRPLHDLPLERLSLGWETKRGEFDFSFLKKMRLTYLRLQGTVVDDLSFLAHLPLAYLNCHGSDVRDLSPLSGAQLHALVLNFTQVSDLWPTADMPLRDLKLNHSRVRDFRPIFHMDIDCLSASGLEIGDLSQLPVERLVTLSVSDNPIPDFEPLRGTMIREMDAMSVPVRDLSPLVGLPLQKLNISDTAVSDIRPLQGLPLSWLSCAGLAIRDLAPLAASPLTFLKLEGTKVSDLRPLAESSVHHLNLAHTPVTSLEALRNCPLMHLDVTGCDIPDDQFAFLPRDCRVIR